MKSRERSAKQPKRIRGLRYVADNRYGYKEFCDNLRMSQSERDETFLKYLFVPSSSGKIGGYMTARAVSREYKKVGSLDALPTSYKRYVSEHRELFASILK